MARGSFHFLFSLLILSFLLSFSSVPWKRAKGFTLKKILSHHLPDPRWQIEESLEVPIKEILSQDYTYLGSGNHCYAFVSRDESYVLKFFKQKHMRTRSWMDFLPLPSKLNPKRLHLIERRKKERESSYRSYKIAYEKLQEETALLYLHLNKSKHLGLHTTIVGPNGNKHLLNMDKMEFLVQKKAEVGYQKIASLLEEEKTSEAVNALSAFLNLIKQRCLKGIYDRDLQFFKNFGFINTHPVEIDVGEFALDSSMKKRDKWTAEIQAVSVQITDWLKEHSPQLLVEFDNKKEEILTTPL